MPEFTPLSSFTGRAREVFSYLVWQAGLHDFEVAWRDEPKIGDRPGPTSWRCNNGRADLHRGGVSRLQPSSDCPIHASPFSN